jgi:hypothetical protein
MNFHNYIINIHSFYFKPAHDLQVQFHMASILCDFRYSYGVIFLKG